MSEEFIHVDSYNYGHIYLLQEREFVNSNEPVYKLGHTKNIGSRLNGYPKGSIVHFICNCIGGMTSDNMEKIFLHYFKKLFKHRIDIGQEYFEGKLFIMINLILKILSSERDKLMIKYLKNDGKLPLHDKENNKVQEFIIEIKKT